MDNTSNMGELGTGVLELEPVELEETDEEPTGDLPELADSEDHDGEDDELTIREEDIGRGLVAVTVIQPVAGVDF